MSGMREELVRNMFVKNIKVTDKGNVLVDFGDLTVLLPMHLYDSKRISVGAELSNTYIIGVLLQALRQRLYTKGYTYLSRSLKPRRRLKDVLQKAVKRDKNYPALLKLVYNDASSASTLTGLAEEMIETVCDQLESEGLLDDLQYAESFIASRRSSKPRSVWMIKNELFAKGIAKEDAEMACERIGLKDEDLLKLAYEKYIRTHGRVDAMKLMKYLSSKGFNYYDIKSFLEKA